MQMSLRITNKLKLDQEETKNDTALYSKAFYACAINPPRPSSSICSQRPLKRTQYHALSLDVEHSLDVNITSARTVGFVKHGFGLSSQSSCNSKTFTPALQPFTGTRLPCGHWISPPVLGSPAWTGAPSGTGPSLQRRRPAPALKSCAKTRPSSRTGDLCRDSHT